MKTFLTLALLVCLSAPALAQPTRAMLVLAEEEHKAVAAKVKKPEHRHGDSVRNGPCSDQCTCGCQDGYPCRCSPLRAQPAHQPAYLHNSTPYLYNSAPYLRNSGAVWGSYRPSGVSRGNCGPGG